MCAATATATEECWGRGIARHIGGGFSHESEHDLALMVSDFLENNNGGGVGSSGADSWCSSDSDSGLSDLHLLADKISCNKHLATHYENDLRSLVHSLLLSIKDTDLNLVKSVSCNAAGCIRFSLVKLLRLRGYDAAICASRWQGGGKVPGGDYEYIDVVNHNGVVNSERFIIDIDFQSHFEIARAVDSYDRILKSLPVVFVGSLTQLKQYLQVMAEATKSSLKQNSMPLPPWRSLAYLQAKWNSPYQRQYAPNELNFSSISSSDHEQCWVHLKRLHSLLHIEMEEGLLKPINSDNWRMKFERRRHSLLRPL